MKIPPVFLGFCLLLSGLLHSQTVLSPEGPPPPGEDSIMLQKIFANALGKGQSYQNLEYLSKKIGHRISGSENAEKAVKWAQSLMQSYKFDTVYLQECMVPRWVRGPKETCFYYTKNNKTGQPFNILALGGSIATPKDGINAEVVEVTSWEDLKTKGVKGEIKGKIVFFNRPFDVTLPEPFNAYGRCVDQRFSGAMRAAKYGAVMTLVRSMTTKIDLFPHTGSMGYNDSLPKIPGAAIATQHAEMLVKLLKEDPKLKLLIKMGCQTLPDVKSYNVIGELWGTDDRNQVVVVGGHLDSWDVGEGSHDDGAGIVQSIEVLRIFKSLGIKPKRTIRVVCFMNEENGGRGAKKYAEVSKTKNEVHIAAIESDRGGFAPRGFTCDTLDARYERVMQWAPLFKPYMMDRFTPGGSGADVHALKYQGCLTIGYFPDPQRYFDYHHTEADVFEAINQRELEMGAAAMAMMVYLLTQYGVN